MWPCGSSGCAAQRAGEPSRGDDPSRAFHERARDGWRHPDPEEVGAVLVLVVIVVGVDGLAVLVHGAGLDEDQLRAAVPAEGQRPGPERLDERLVERRRVRQRRSHR